MFVYDNRFEDFVYLIEALHKQIGRIKSEQAHLLGFRGADVMCLYYLSRKGDQELSAADLARKLDMSRASLSRTLSYLSDAGLVQIRTTDGKYRAPLELTAEGKKAAEPIGKISASILERSGEVVPAERREAMKQDLSKILACLKSI